MKRTTTRLAIIGVTGLAAAAALGFAPAQERRTADSDRSSASKCLVGEKDMACLLIIDNAVQVQLSQFAAKNARNDKVKQFAEKMAKEHKSFIDKLERTAGAKGFSDKASNGILGKDATRRPARTSQRGKTELAQLKIEIAQKALASTKKALQAHDQQHFDKAFMGMQIMVHQLGLDAMQVVENHATSPEFQKTLKEGIATTRQHLAEAKQIMQQLKKDSAARTQ
jgi:predicted outer membrane protein